MRTRTLLLSHWMLLASLQLMGAGCGGSETVQFPPPESDGGRDATTGTGGTTTGDGGGAAGSSGTAGAGGAGTAGTGGTGGAAGSSGASGSGGASGRGGTGGASGASGRGGAAGASGATGSGGAAGVSGASGSGGAAGASGAAGSGGAAGASGASGAAGASGNAGSSGSAGSGVDAGADGDANTADVGSDGDVTADAAGDAGCPNVFGTYEFNNTNGPCGDLVESAPQEIRGTVQACFLHFISVPDSGTGAINGGATLGADGTFSGATLTLGTTIRNPCIGSWDAAQGELTVVCNSGAGNECLMELRRTGP